MQPKSFTSEIKLHSVDPGEGITRCNQLMNDQDHYFQPRKLHGIYFPHQPQLQPET